MIRKWWIAVAAVPVAVAALAVAANANLTGSNFESVDGNMVVNTAGNHDWINAPNLSVGTDLATGQTDNSFGNGTQENDVNVTVGLGSIPNAKADLGKFAVASETVGTGDVMMYLAWTRNDLSGTTNFDFELNKAAQPDLTTAGHKTLVRTAGDVLINYALLGGAQTPTLTRRVWTGSVWGPEVAFSSSVADGAINTAAPVQNTLGGGGNIPASEFGEAAINMTAAGLIANQNDPNAPCTGFGSAYVKSRASSSFTSEIKDFIAPVSLNLSNCGAIKVVKVTDPSPDPTNTSFPFTASYTSNFSLHNGENSTVMNIKAGSGYSVSENLPSGWDLTSAVCDHGTPANITVIADTTTTCTFTNTGHGNIIVRKHTDPAGTPGSFGFDASYNASGFSLSDGQSNDSGPIATGTYSVSENTPANWTLSSATCDNNDSPSAIHLAPGATVTCDFTNTAHGSITVTKLHKHAADGPGDHPEAGVTFTVNGVSHVTGADGTACFDGLTFGSYVVHETVPAGESNAANDQSVVVNAVAGCPGGAAGNTITYHNVPLTDIHVSAHSQAPGGTVTNIDCGAIGTDNGGDPHVDALSLAPGTYTCTIVVDP